MVKETETQESNPRRRPSWLKTFSCKSKSATIISALSHHGSLVYEQDSINAVIDEAFKKKFNCSTSPPISPDAYDLPSDEVLGVPDVNLTDEQSRAIVDEFTIDELNKTLDTLDESKAEGPDQITNSMLKNWGPIARDHTLDFFNSVLLGGVCPEDWKVGKVILTLKRPPASDVGNYRPITLISCLSKVLSKMVAKRITTAVDASGIAGDLQNGFRPKRRCADNIFIANTLLDLNRQKKLLSYLMFVDLKEAYDMVDRGILFRKLLQYNFPPQLISYLQEYYFADCISTSSAGKKSSTLYQTRGLRQGCNLSSILFVIYLCELSRRLNAAKLGIGLSTDILIAYLLFANNIILLGHNEDEVSALKTILEIWCMDFRMRIGAKKTQLITPVSDVAWSIIDVATGDIQELETVESYRYLGIDQKITLRKTANAKSKTMISKANYYASTILRLKSTVPDKLEVYRATWENIATPAILYGADVLPVTIDTYQLQRARNDSTSCG